MSRRICKNMYDFAILNNIDKQKESTVDQTFMHIKEGTRSKQLPEIRRGGKSGFIVARAGEPQSSRQVQTRNPGQTGTS